MELDKTMPWTHKSQYLVEVTLTGKLNSNIQGNKENNILKGNAGNNIINGKGGDDTACFKGNFSEYKVIKMQDKITVKDLLENRDGTDTLLNIEKVLFLDQIIQTSSLMESNFEI